MLEQQCFLQLIFVHTESYVSADENGYSLPVLVASMLKDRLDRIIEIKEKVMDDKERELEEEKLKLNTIDVAIEQVKAEIDENYTKLEANPIKGNDFSVIKDYLEYLENKKCGFMKDRLSVEEAITLVKQELVELMQEKKMLDKLREKELSVLKKTMNRKEQKLLDDMALRGDEKKI